MLTSIRRSVSGLVAQFNRIATISNNISNAQTPGHKRQVGSFSELLVQAIDERSVPVLSPQSRLVHGVEFQTEHDFSQGDLVPTGRALDIALEGKGFLQLEDIDGRPVFARGGAFTLDANGRLVHSSGAFVSGITVPEGASVIDIDEQGVISFAVDGTVVAAGALLQVTFANPTGLVHMGRSIFAVSENSGDPQEANGRVRQGFLEASNVTLLEEMTQLMRAQRAYQANANSVRNLDEMWERTTDLRR